MNGAARMLAGLSAIAGRRPLAAGVLAGLCWTLLMGLSFPPVGVWGIAPLAVTPLAAFGMLGVRGWGRAGVGAAIGAAGFWAVQMRWVGSISVAGYAPLVVYLCAFVGVYTAGASAVCRRVKAGWARAVLAACLWVLVEFVRTGVIFGGFAWYAGGHPLIEAGPLLSWPARIGGADLVSALAAAAGVSVAAVVTGAARRGGAATLGVLVLGWLGGGALVLLGTPSGEARTLEVAVVQTNVPQSVRGGWDPEARQDAARRFLRMTLAAGEGGAELIVWPETMFPGLALQPEALDQFRPDAARYAAGERDAAALWAAFELDIAEALLKTQARVGAAVLVGASAYEGFAFDGSDRSEPGRSWTRRFNSVFLVQDGAVRGRYDKSHLTPFGEVIPYLSSWPWLERTVLEVGLGASGMSFNLSAGSGGRTLTVAGAGGEVAVSPRICFEATDAGVVRGTGAADVGDVLVNATNDGWFGSWRAGREAHLLGARWRCVELDRAMIRAANTGLSALVDRWGRVEAWGTDGAPGADGVEGVLSGRVELASSRTAYMSGGALTAYLTPGIAVAAGLFAAAAGKGRSTGGGVDGGGDGQGARS